MNINAMSKKVKVKITDDYEVTAILTVEGLDDSVVADLIREYERSVERVDIGRLNEYIQKQCRANGQTSYLTFT